MIKKIILKLIKSYQRFSFLGKPFLAANSDCRFRPTCSEYFYQAVERYGILKGSWLGVKRIAQCHPRNKGGWDPISDI